MKPVAYIIIIKKQSEFLVNYKSCNYDDKIYKSESISVIIYKLL